MSDETKKDGDLADTVFDAADSLNVAIAVAVEQGLHIEIDVRVKSTFGGRDVPSVEVDVYKPLRNRVFTQLV